MKKFFLSLFSEDSKISSKRFISITGFFFLVGTMLVNSFLDASKIPADNLVGAVEFVTIVAIGGVASEKFSSLYMKHKFDTGDDGHHHHGQGHGHDHEDECDNDQPAIEVDKPKKKRGRPKR